MSAARSARRPVPAILFLLALAVLAVVVWVRVADRDSAADTGGPTRCATAPQLPSNAAVTVTVLNGTEKNGLATQVLDAFKAVGFTGGNVDNADTQLPGIATITYGPNGALSALLVSYYLPGSAFVSDSREDTSVTVTVGAGYTGLGAGPDVAAALAKASLSQTPAPTPAGTASGSSPAASPSPAATCTTTPPAPTPPVASATPATS